MAHLYAAYKCSYCYELPESAPLYHCPNRHQYCLECFNKLQRLYRGPFKGGGCCLVCKFSGRFEESDITTEFLKKLKKKPGPSKCAPKSPTFNYNDRFHKPTFHQHNQSSFRNNHVEKSQGDGLKLRSFPMMRTVSSTHFSRRPLTCLHNGCNKFVAVCSLVSHFKHEHIEVPSFRIEKRKYLNLQHDLSLVEYDRISCLAMITIYEHSIINVDRSRSTQSVINTCLRLSSTVPLNTFWLMMSCSPANFKKHAYAIFWLFSNSEDRYYCTLELSSISDRMNVSSFCSAVASNECRTAEDVTLSMNCLYINFARLSALGGKESTLNLRVLVH